MFNMGYWLYFPMVATLSFYYFFKRPSEVERCTFIIMAAFFLHYIIYIFLPVAGPQFYFPIIGEEAASSGVYENIGNYFNQHPDISIAQEGKGVFFTELVNMAQRAGERPTAAFPSSHVGVSIVMMILALRGSRKLFFGLLPFFILLCCATVYIKAHYLIDALTGALTGILTYFITSWIYRRFLQRS
jgi:membrane-associated phospholipid phosphatase